LTYVKFQGAIFECMRAKGWRYSPPPFASGSEHLRRPRFDEDALWPIDRQALSDNGLGVAVDSRAAWTELQTGRDPIDPGPLDDETRDRYSKAVDECEPSSDTYADLWSSYGVASLRVEWSTLKTEATTVAEVREAQSTYRSCMEASGWAVESPPALVDRLREQFRTVDGGLLDPRSALFTRAASEEKRAAVADASCRADAHRAAVLALASAGAELEARRETELVAAEAQFDRLTVDMSANESLFQVLERAAKVEPAALT
jgi:hypothetical protein